MKTTTIIAGLSLYAFASMSYAVVVEVTGATAFRAATLLAIKAKFEQSNVPYQFAHDQVAGDMSAPAPNATRAIFKGSMRNAANTANIPNVVVRCTFNGSVEGINALVNNIHPTYYTDIPGNFITAAAHPGGGETHKDTVGFLKTASATGAESIIAFSDVAIGSTPFAASPVLGGPVGVVVFTMIANEGAPASLTNVTGQQFRALMQTGYAPLSLFSGIEADSPLDPAGDGVGPNAQYIFGTGRNDGSGTRTAYLAETGAGVSRAVKQYINGNLSDNPITKLQLVPWNGTATAPQVVPPGVAQLADNKSSIWPGNVGSLFDGNGGYSSGSKLRDDMGKTSASVTVYEAGGDDAFGETVKATLVTWLSLNDAATARIAGAKFLAYNGESLAVDVTVNGFPNSGMNATDIAKVTNGRYSAWSFQQMYLDSAIDSSTPTEIEQVAVYNSIFNGVQTNASVAGLPVGAMYVGRPGDGGTVAP